MEEAYQYSDHELTKLGDAIVWMAVLASVHNDGVILISEKAEAVKQAHIRTYSAPDYLRPIYRFIDEQFEARFDAFSAELRGTQQEKEEHIRIKLSEALEILPELGPLFTQRFSQDMKQFYNRIFRADSNAFQIFAFPVITAHLDKFGLK